MSNDKLRTSFIYSMSIRFKRNIFMLFYVLAVLILISFVMIIIEGVYSGGNDASLLFGFEIKKGIIELAVGVIGSLIAVVVGIFISVFFELPYLFVKFDEIKNKIAIQEINNCIQLAKEINTFFVSNLKYTFLPVDYSLIKILQHPIQASDDRVFQMLKNEDIKKIEAIARDSPAVRQVKIDVSESSKIRTYVVPIYFYKRYMGMWVVMSKACLLKPFLDFLSDVEENLIDDQVMHVLNYEKMIMMRKMFEEVDKISNKISLNYFNNIDEYISEFLKLVVAFCNFIGGACITVYGNNTVAWFSESIVEFDRVKLLNASKCLKTNRIKIIGMPEFSDKNVLVVPIIIEKLRGILYFYDIDVNNLEYHSQLMQDIGSLKFDNDLEALAAKLDLTAVNDLS